MLLKKLCGSALLVAALALGGAQFDNPSDSGIEAEAASLVGGDFCRRVKPRHCDGANIGHPTLCPTQVRAWLNFPGSFKRPAPLVSCGEHLQCNRQMPAIMEACIITP